MDIRQKNLKRGIICSVLHHGDTLGLVCESYDPWEFSTLTVGWSRNLKVMLKAFFRAQLIDRHSPGDPQSTFLMGTADLMASLEQTGAIFVGNPKGALIDIFSRLMAYTGWRTQFRRTWMDGVSDVDRDETREERSKKYRRLFKKHWNFHELSEENHFEDNEAWVRENLGGFSPD